MSLLVEYKRRYPQTRLKEADLMRNPKTQMVVSRKKYAAGKRQMARLVRSGKAAPPFRGFHTNERRAKLKQKWDEARQIGDQLERAIPADQKTWGTPQHDAAKAAYEQHEAEVTAPARDAYYDEPEENDAPVPAPAAETFYARRRRRRYAEPEEDDAPAAAAETFYARRRRRRGTAATKRRARK